MTDSAQMPRYQCHKKVRALKIVHVEKVPREYLLHVDNRTETTAQGMQSAMAAASRDATETFWHPIVVSEEWFSKHKPEAGGYYVVYEDGYASYSPAKAFEEGYTRLSAPEFTEHQSATQPHGPDPLTEADVVVGRHYIWMPDSLAGSCKVVVDGIRRDPNGDVRVFTTTLASRGINQVGVKVWNDMSRFLEACVAAPTKEVKS